MLLVEFGYINTVNSVAGTASVNFKSRKVISGEMQIFAPAGEYYMPKQGDQVVVIRTGRGASDGVILGGFWNEKNPPPVSSGVYKDMGNGASIKQSEGTITFTDAGGSISVGEIISRLKKLEAAI